MKVILFITLCTFCMECGSSLVSVEYLRKAQRFNMSQIDDYYFCCNSVGSVIQWGVNGQTLGGYTSSDVGKTVVSSGNGYNFTTSLLSARPEEQRIILDSILVISVYHASNITLEVLCTNNVDINTTSNMIDPKLHHKGNITQDTEIGFEYVLAAPIVQQIEPSLLTHIFVCGTKSLSQVIGVPAVRALWFDATNKPGKTRNVQTNNDTVDFQVILAARFPYYETTSFAFVTSKLEFSIICSDNSYAKTFTSSSVEYPVRSSTYSFPSVSSPSISSLTTTSTTNTRGSTLQSTGHTGTSLNPYTEATQNSRGLIAIAIVIAIAVTILIIFIVLSITYAILKKKQKNIVTGCVSRDYTLPPPTPLAIIRDSSGRKEDENRVKSTDSLIPTETEEDSSYLHDGVSQSHDTQGKCECKMSSAELFNNDDCSIQTEQVEEYNTEAPVALNPAIEDSTETVSNSPWIYSTATNEQICMVIEVPAEAFLEKTVMSSILLEANYESHKEAVVRIGEKATIDASRERLNKTHSDDNVNIDYSNPRELNASIFSADIPAVEF